MTAKSLRWSCVLVTTLCLAAPLRAQEEAAEESVRPKLDFSLEAKANYRDSDENRFAVPFFDDDNPATPPSVFEETVNQGSHVELSTVTLLVNATWGDGLTAHGKIDFIDLYDRNPTSTDKKVDLDEGWVRFGIEPEPAALAPRWGAYLKVGKMPKFERQDDRHLESYGLVSTAFNRMEDTGAELGLNLGRHVYVKATATQGNPVFMRDPNALAGDNGTPEFLKEHPDPQLKSGIVILYDAEVEDLDVDGNLELGAGLGARFADEAGSRGLDVLAWGYKRKLADTVELEGTFYGGDLDIFSPSDNPNSIFAIHGDEKREVGANVWLYLGGFSFFGQYVDQKLAGLPRTGLEGEVAWRFDLPLALSIGDQQLFTFIAPAVRYSRLDNDFGNPKKTSAPSFSWDWVKIDAGVRLGIISGVDLTVEYEDNTFTLGSGAERDNNELLTTLRWKV
ncbi:MAG TPA: hypothetical protein VH394_26875 [Thermoanaerobaculia bacterium]|jgi:hypothetical protein|nr:hypothetical protein [Thermoanaerobaculia bacterium]